MSRSVRDHLPIDPVPAGEILARELDARGWSQADFASVLDRPTQFVSEILNGKKEITRESAAQIGAALGHTAEYWLNLQDQYLLAEQYRSESTQVRLDEVRRRARLNEKGPIQLLKKRGFLSDTTLDALEAEVKALFELNSLDDDPAFAIAAKRANPNEKISLLQGAWVACVRKKARELPPQKSYSAKELGTLAAKLPRSLQAPREFNKLPDLLSHVGVRLVYVELFPGAKIDGCAALVDGYPVIGLSGRGKRLDKVLFALLHEIAHIVLGHVDTELPIVDDLDDKNSHENVREKAANQHAEEFTFPNGFPVVPTRIGGPWVDQVASSVGVAPIVIIGQLQHRGHLEWRTTLTRNAPSVIDALEQWR